MTGQIPPNPHSFFITSPLGTKRKEPEAITPISAIASSALSQSDGNSRSKKKRRIFPTTTKALPPKQLWKEQNKENDENRIEQMERPLSQERLKAKIQSSEASAIWKLLANSGVDKHDQALRALELVNHSHFNINYCPGNESKGKTIFWLAALRCHLPILEYILEQFPNVDVNTAGLYTEKPTNGSSCKDKLSQQATAFAIFIRQLTVASSNPTKDVNFFQKSSSIIATVLEKHPEADVNAIVPSNQLFGGSILYDLYFLMRVPMQEFYSNNILYILENFPNTNINQNGYSLFYYLATGYRGAEFVSAILNKNLRFNPTADLSLQGMVERKLIAPNFYPQLVLQAYRFQKESHRLADESGNHVLPKPCNFTNQMMELLLYKTEKDVSLQNLACLYMTGRLKLPPPSQEAKRTEEIKAKIKEWNDIFYTFEIFFQASQSEVSFPTEIFHCILVNAFSNDPYMDMISPELIVERFYNRPSSAAIAIVNLIFIKLQKNYKHFKNLAVSRIREKKQTIWKSLDTALTEMNETTILLTQELRRKLIDGISKKRRKPPRMSSHFIKLAISTSLNEKSNLP